MIAPSDVIRQARTWIDVPYVHQGRSRLGADCLGFISACLAELGSSVFLDYLPVNYARYPQAVLIDGLQKLTRQIDQRSAALALIRWPRAEYPSHAGILTADGSIIHCYETLGRVIEHGFRAPWDSRTVSFWALPLVRYP